MKTLKVLSLFSGIGAFEKSLENLGVDVELVGFSEIDKYAIKSFCAIHNVDESLNFGDVSKINKPELPDFDLLVGGSPCQAFSVAGHRKGFEDTRGTLFFQYVETLKHKQPKFFVYENVKGLINHDKGNTLDTIAQSFSEVGYRIDIELLNSKYFNVPQNRERIYIIGIRENLIENEEWNIDEKRNGVLVNGKRRLKDLGIKSFNFKYPKQESVNLKLRDILETNVDEKFYISNDKAAKLIKQLEKTYTEPIIMDGKNSFGNNHKVFDNGIAPTCLSNDYKEPKKVVEPFIVDTRQHIDGCNMLGRLEMKGNDSIKRVYDPDGMSPTLTTMGGGNTEPKIVIEDINCLNTYTNGTQTQQQDRVYDPNGQMVALTSSLNGRFNIISDEVRPVLTPDREEKRQEGRRFKENDEPAFTVNTIDKHGVATGEYPKYKIRKLTPLECFRLQAFSDEDFQKCVDIGISNSQLYKQAGNSITVTVLEKIFKELLSTYI
jgi:DNA (cytosine-5)-methyltransferase 1